MKKILAFLIVSTVAMTPFFAEAHVKWFTILVPQKETIEHILSPLFLTLAIVIALLLGFLALFIPKTTNWTIVQKWDEKLSGFRKYSRYLLKYGTAAAFILQVMNGTLFAPEFHIEQMTTAAFVWAAIVFLCIPHHVATKAGAAVLLGLFVYVAAHNSIFHMLDYGFYLGIIAVLLIGKTRFEEKGFPLLYLGTGLSLCWVAVEKWVYPTMSLDIVSAHHVPTFGFDPALFIVMAAFIEFIVGYLLVVGILNRVVGLVVTIIFIMTTMLFGFTEIIGHFMIHIILIIFIIEGVSFYNPPIKLHKTKLDQFIFVFLNFLFVLSTFLLIYYRFA